MKLTIGNKLFGVFLFILLLLGIGSLVSINKINATEESYKQLIVVNVENAMHAKDLQMLFSNESNAVEYYLLTGENTYIEKYQNYLSETNKEIDVMLNVFKSEKDLEIINQLSEFQNQFDQLVQQEISHKKEGDVTGYTKLWRTEGENILSGFQERISQLDKEQEKIVFSGMESVASTVQKTKIFVLILGICSIVVGVILSVILSRSISNPIKRVANAMQKVSDGNLQVETLPFKTKDEVGDLVNSYNKMIHDLREMVGQVKESSTSVAATSEELAASAEQSSSASELVSKMTQDSAEGIEYQLVQYNDLFQSIDEMNTGIQQIAGNSEEMLEITEKTSTLTNDGEKIIDHVVGQMNQIQNTVAKATTSIYSLSQRSNEISAIIEIITGVAEQTNLLALNAAIEAARAGDHGKGFAVVADEVRKLAEASKQSAGQITNMINQIQIETNESVKMMKEENEQVQLGLKETEDAYYAFKTISSAMGEVTEKVVEVSASVQQMIASSNQIVEAVNKTRGITERTAHNSQESAAATQEQFAAMEEVSASAQYLSKMAENLQTIISGFKL